MYDIQRFYRGGQRPQDGDELVLGRNGTGWGPFPRGKGAAVCEKLNDDLYFVVKISFAGSSLVIKPIGVQGPAPHRRNRRGLAPREKGTAFPRSET